MSTTIKVNDQGEVVLPEDILKHLGVKPGDVVEVEVIPGGNAVVRPPAPTRERKGTMQELFNVLPRRPGPAPTIEEMNEVIAKGWAGEL